MKSVSLAKNVTIFRQPWRWSKSWMLICRCNLKISAT